MIVIRRLKEVNTVDHHYFSAEKRMGRRYRTVLTGNLVMLDEKAKLNTVLTRQRLFLPQSLLLMKIIKPIGF